MHSDHFEMRVLVVYLLTPRPSNLEDVRKTTMRLSFRRHFRARKQFPTTPSPSAPTPHNNDACLRLLPNQVKMTLVQLHPSFKAGSSQAGLRKIPCTTRSQIVQEENSLRHCTRA